MDLTINVSEIIACQDYRSNLINNPSFESGTDGWNVDSAFNRVVGGHTGGYSVKLSGSGGWNNLFYPQWPYDSLTVYPGKTYTLTFSYRTESHIYGQPLPRLIIADGSDPWQWNGLTGTSYITLGDTYGHWKTLTAVLNTGTATSLFIRISENQTQATVYFDSFCLQLGESADYIETTQSTFNALPDYNKNQPLNLAIGNELNMMLNKPKMSYWNTANRPSQPARNQYGFNYETGNLEMFAVPRNTAPGDEGKWIAFPFQLANTLVPN